MLLATRVIYTMQVKLDLPKQEIDVYCKAMYKIKGI